jgi:simple sugar transport system ATP-binding protein
LPDRDLALPQRKNRCDAVRGRKLAEGGFSQLVLMDEPTAAVGVAETAKVESIIRTLKARGLAILLISHRLDQVFRLADRICVLRRGVQVGVKNTTQTDNNEIVAMITGLA